MGRLRDALRWLYRRSSWTGANGLGHRLWEHTQYVGAATLVALVAGTAIGLAVGRRRKPVVRLLWGLARTLPMLGAVAVLGTSGQGSTWLLLGALGLLVAPTVAGATAAGARSVPVEAVVAAHGLGFDRAERWRGVVLPLTLPHALAGLRAAAVQVVGDGAVAEDVVRGQVGRWRCAERAGFGLEARAQLLGAQYARWITEQLIE